MAEADNNTNYDEFIVDSSKLSLVHKFKDKIEQMFSVIVYIDESTDQKGEKSWLRVDGQKCDRKDAREYILAVCHPQSIQKLQIKDSDKASFDDETLEDIERKTNARIKLRGNTLKIFGSEISVILAMTTLEDMGAVGMEDTEADGETDGMNEVSKKNGVKNRWTSKVDLQLEKLLCNPSNNTESISISDFTKSSPSIKMTILKCMTDMDDDVSDSDLFPSSRDEAPSYKLQVFDESDEDKEDYVDGKNVNQLTDKLTTAQISPSPEKPTPKETCNTPDVCLFRTFGKSVGYSEAEVEEGLTLCNTKTTPADFLNILNEVQEKKKQLGEKNFSDEISIDASQKTNFPPPPDVPSALFSPVSGRRSLPNEYKERLVKDFTEETADLPVEELKKRNEERQKVLKSSFDKNVGQLSDTKSPQKKKRKKKKKKKKANPVKYIGEGSKENPAIVCSSDDDEEQTKVMAIWHEKDSDEASDSDCMIVEESFPENAAQKKPTGQNSNTSSNQDNTGQKTAKSSGEQWTVVGNPQKTRFQQPDFNKPPPLMPTPQAPLIQQPPFIPQLLPFNQPPGAGHLSNPGDFPPYREEGMGNNMNRLNATNPIPSAAMTAPVLGVGPISGGSQKNLRYIVIDGSNVAMCHGCNKVFSCRGIKIVIDYFLQRGHTQITAFVPEWRRYNPRPENPILDQPLLNQMKEDGHLVFTPARRINNRLIAAYDDRFVLELAEREEGIIVSNDQYRDLMTEKYSWRKIIEERLLLFSFVKDNFMPPFDPLGRNGPNLDEFLCKPLTRKRGVNQYPPPYNRERNPQTNAWLAGKRQHDQYNRRPQENQGGWPRPQYAPQRQNNNYWNQQQQQAGGGGNNPQKSQKSGPPRSKAATKEIEVQLKAIFPENASKINEILQNHPSETNVEKLSNYLLNAI